MLLAMAIGDAYGSAFEYAPAEFVEAHNYLDQYHQHPHWDKLKPGCYTDDTQMALAVAEHVLSCQPWTKELLAGRFLSAFHRDRRRGYSAGFYHFLKRVKSADDFIASIDNCSYKSGGAMRAAPCGAFSSIEVVKSRAALQASVTHDTIEGRNAASAVALAAHYFLYDLGPKRDLGAFLDKHVSTGGHDKWNTRWTGPVEAWGWMAVQAALTAIMDNDYMSGILQQSVAFTGDTDTVAAIALSIAACSNEVTDDIPQVLCNQLEDGTYGRQYISDLNRHFLERVAIWRRG